MAPETIHTARLTLAPVGEADLPRLCAIAALRSIADTTISIPHPFEPADGQAFLARYAAGSGNLGWGIHPSDAIGTFVGFTGLNHVDHEHQQAEISFWIDPAWSGRGMVTEAAAALLDHAENALGLHRIEAYHMARNPGSGRVLQKLGFRQEGLLRDRVRKWGQREDVLLWSRIFDREQP